MTLVLVVVVVGVRDRHLLHDAHPDETLEHHTNVHIPRLYGEIQGRRERTARVVWNSGEDESITP